MIPTSGTGSIDVSLAIYNVGIGIQSVSVLDGYTVLLGNSSAVFSKYSFSSNGGELNSLTKLENLGLKEWFIYSDKIGFDIRDDED